MDFLRKENNFRYPDVVDSKGTIKSALVHYLPETTSEFYKDLVTKVHYMTISIIEINNEKNVKVSYFLNTSDFTK